MRFVSLFLIFAAVAQAQETSQPTRPPFIRVHGQASVSVPPDEVRFDIGVATHAATAKAASDENNRQSAALIQALRTAFPSSNATSINLSVNPNYRYQAGGAATVTGYTANNTVRFILDDLSKLQTVIDIAIKSGAQSVNRLNFTLRNENAARAQALADAASQAQAGAEALAAALKLKLGRLLSAEEAQPVIVSLPREITLEKLQPASLQAILPGTVDVHADVDLTYEIVERTDPPGEKERSSLHSTARK